MKSLRLDNAEIQCLGLTYLWLALSDPDDPIVFEYLSVRQNSIDSGWANRLNYKLCSPLKVKTFDLSENKLGQSSARPLSEFFSENPYLEVLDVSYNKFKREGLRYLKELMAKNQKLQKLIVKGTKRVEESIEMCERRARVKENL